MGVHSLAMMERQHKTNSNLNSRIITFIAIGNVRFGDDCCWSIHRLVGVFEHLDFFCSPLSPVSVAGGLVGSKPKMSNYMNSTLMS